MLFCSEQFLVFFTLIFALYWAMPWHRARILLLLVASFYFYASWNRWLALIIGVSTTIDYFVARGIEASSDPRRRKLLLSITIIGNLSLLCYFKYANFFLHSVEEALTAMGSTASMPVLQVILPIGISFYTFEAINYGVDVYRRHVPAERNLAHFMLFITFFPHLVAGPIVRARDFLPQINRRKHWDWARMQLGVQFFLMGLFKKLAIADRMALFADPVFANPEQYRTTAVWLAVLAYALQIYCDFSGYTDMALGTAHMLGFKLAQNFDMPYSSANISEFWRRWHISLSSWLRDYLFIPLGGSRGTSWQTNRNLLITMTLGGLWHGASWTFVIWGVIHGLVLVGHRYFRTFCQSRPKLNDALLTAPGTAIRIALTFVTVSLAWIFFRATTFSCAMTMFSRMFVRAHGLGPPMAKDSLLVLTAIVIAAHAFALSGVWKKWSVRMPAPLLGMSYAVLLTITLVLAPDAGKAFIYFQF
ncbi:MAG TPA: MBOAT family protein [Pirellulales bacterium]|nr:MBOAT family protein [Pirellulales bacterium]